GESGDVISLHSYLTGYSYKESSKILSNLKYDPEKAKRLLNKNKNVHEKIKVDGDLDIDLENECYSLQYQPKSNFERKILSKLWNFKKKRKIPDSLPLYISHSGRYKGRIIIPIYINNRLVFFQGRSLYKEILPKYLSPEVEKHKIILNIDSFDKEKYIVVTEGIIDAHMIENNQGTCVIGGYIDMDFVDKLLSYTNKGIIICLDNPKIDKNSKYVLKKLLNENINRYSDKIKFFVMPDEYDAKDLNDLVKDYNINNIYDFVVENSINILEAKLKFY
ncbi:MAG: hypothetical protein ACOC2W_04005, partial [bacterium]